MANSGRNLDDVLNTTRELDGQEENITCRLCSLETGTTGTYHALAFTMG